MASKQDLPFVENFAEIWSETFEKISLWVFGEDNNVLEEYLPMNRFPGLQPPGDP